MSGAYIGPDSTFNQEVWRPGLTHETERQTLAMGFVGPDDDMPGVLLEDLTRKRGDTINRNFSPTYDPTITDGAVGYTHLFGDTDETLSNEDEIDTFKDSLVINHLKTAWRVRGVMSQQRVGWDQKQQIFTKAGKIWSRIWDISWLNQLCGYTPAMGASQDDYRLTGHNAVVAPDAAHKFDCSADHTTDQTYDSDDILSMAYIDEMVMRATSKDYVDYPIAPDAEGFYHIIMHTRVADALKGITSATEWRDIQRAQIEGGKPYEQTGLHETFLGVRGRCKLHVSDFCPQGVNSTDATAAVTTVKRGVFFGANAWAWAFGEGFADGDHIDYSEMRAGHDMWSVQASSVFGCKTTIWNGQYFGAMVFSSYVGAA